MQVVVESYRITKLLPRSETYGLVAQIRRAATSIPANIAEGHGREHLGDYLRHLSIAKGSLTELETHLLISHQLSYLSEKQREVIFGLTAEVGGCFRCSQRN